MNKGKDHHVARFLDLLLEIFSSQEHLFRNEIENYNDFIVRKKSHRKNWKIISIFIYPRILKTHQFLQLKFIGESFR